MKLWHISLENISETGINIDAFNAFNALGKLEKAGLLKRQRAEPS